jgi:hypothetical protein
VAFGHQSQHVLLAVGEGAERIPAATACEQLRYEFRIERGAAPSDGGDSGRDLCGRGAILNTRLSEENRLAQAPDGSPGLRTHAAVSSLRGWPGQ